MIKLEVGKRYITRSGYITEPVDHIVSDNSKLLGAKVIDDCVPVRNWHPDGRHMYDSDFDIVREYVEDDLTPASKPCIMKNDNSLTSKELKMRNSPYEVLTAQIEKNEKARVASYAVKVADAKNRAEERLIAAQKALRQAEKVVKKQQKALKKFKKSGDTKHLSIFGV